MKDFHENVSKDATNKKHNKALISEIVSYMMAAILLLIGVKCIVFLGLIPSKSMEPTLQVHDVTIGNRLAYKKKIPQRGDLIIFSSDELDEVLCKRIIGLPGETVSFHNGFVYINDERLDESAYLSDEIETNSIDSFTVPDNSYFVLGDNRENSNDSRFWSSPYVSIDNIEAKVLVTIPTHTLFE